MGSEMCIRDSLSEATSQDESYLGINPQDVALTNTDDESGIPGFIVTAPDNATTTESGQDRTFTVKLAAKPVSDVSISVYVSDSSEALLTENWTHSYTRKKAAYPVAALREGKLWPPVSLETAAG